MVFAAVQLLGGLALGVAVGLLGGLFGIGGGVLAIPVLGMLYGLEQQAAQGTVLVMVAPNVLLAFWRYRQRFGVDLRIAATLGISALAATYPAARIATGVDPHALRVAFAVFLGVLSAFVGYRTWRGLAAPPGRAPLAWRWTAVVGAVGGVISGFFGVGGAFIAPPALTAWFGLRQAEAQGLGLALVAPGTIGALVAYAEAGQVAWHIGLPMAVGGLAAISAGVAAAQRLPERQLRLGFCAVLFVTAAALVLHG